MSISACSVPSSCIGLRAMQADLLPQYIDTIVNLYFKIIYCDHHPESFAHTLNMDSNLAFALEQNTLSIFCYSRFLDFLPKTLYPKVDFLLVIEPTQYALMYIFRLKVTSFLKSFLDLTSKSFVNCLHVSFSRIIHKLTYYTICISKVWFHVW